MADNLLYKSNYITGGIMGEKIKNFRDLEVWKLGIEIVKDVYELTANFPKSELYGLAAQMRKAAVSIPSNIAEGFNRYYSKEYKHFLNVSLGSCGELETQLEISIVLQYTTREKITVLIDKIDHESRMLKNLIKKLE